MVVAVNLLFVDAYDSFSASITSLLRQIGNTRITTIKIDTDIQTSYLCSTEEFLNQFDCVVLGPGPGHPANKSDVGLFEIVWVFAESHHIPVFGICLGFQTLGLRYGLKIERLPLPCHGHAKYICHGSTDIFHDVGKVTATQYNSLGFSLSQSRAWMAATRLSSIWNLESSTPGIHHSKRRTSMTDTIPGANGLQLLAWNEDGDVMAIRHQSLPFWGVQFHPESCKSSKSSQKLLQNWLQCVEPKTRSSKITRPIKQKQTKDLEQSPTADEDLSSYLLDLTSHVGEFVENRIFRTTATRQQIADFCYSKSVSGQCVMLESTKKGRYSIYGFPYAKTWMLDFNSSECHVHVEGQTRHFYGICTSKKMSLIENLLAKRKVLQGHPESPFWGGLAGFLSYELGLQFLNIDQKQEEHPSTVPEISLVWIDHSIVVDNETGNLYVQSLQRNDSWLNEIGNQLNQFTENIPETGRQNVQKLLSSITITLPQRQPYVQSIQVCRSELLAGNSYELCLTTEALVQTLPSRKMAFALYNNIQQHNPVPYAAYLELGDMTILCSSPEKFLSWSRRGVLDMVPMKGTVKKSPEMTFDKASAILSTPKESAENLMIADLIRHDLHTALDNDESQVEVIRLCDVVEHETVYQLVSHIQAHAQINEIMSSGEVADAVIKTGCRALQYALPPGSMTGAPKKRSCEILQGLEQRSRGVYAGVIGYFDVGGGGSWNVCIRSAFSSKLEDKDEMQTWHIGAGGAITVLSDEEEEWQEMNTKLDSILKGFRE